MKFKFIILFVVVFFSLSATAGKFDYVVSDIPHFYDHLSEKKTRQVWGAFAPVKLKKGAKFPINIQFSKEAGVVGLDFGLSSPGNNRVLRDFIGMGVESGINFKYVSSPNGFSYYRSTDEGIRDFPVKFLTKFYGMKITDKVDYFSGG